MPIKKNYRSVSAIKREGLPGKGHIVEVLLQIRSGSRYLVEENTLWFEVICPALIRVDVCLHIRFVPRSVYAVGSGRHIPQY